MISEEMSVLATLSSFVAGKTVTSPGRNAWISARASICTHKDIPEYTADDDEMPNLSALHARDN